LVERKMEGRQFVDGIGRLDIEGEPVKVFTKTGRRKRVMREGTAVFKLLPGEDEALLVGMNAGVDIKGDGVLKLVR
jgi:hypothetical protein